jgi:hypothetical protein
MTKLTPIKLDDGTIIYMEAKEEIQLVSPPEATGEVTRGDLGRRAEGSPAEQVMQSFRAIEGTIRAYTNYTLNAFGQVASANIDKVTLEFGIKVGGKAGIPYVTEGSADCNLKVTVECSFPPQDNNLQ